ncbi:hypothetical protein AI29_14775 [bacteria symbiont BFo2 of Frankliniella occidentalis]|nr:hypothetical protein AI29_14775 [bacteria symbiont BFo2 of Frankliniella occidentalis]KYP90965.1 hypothetical protein WB60_07175 [bacteria symbiont BFo2 of Frankliniella occidentalis]KYP95996.1 hypothetical protein WB67_04040 [bacteria symbiont BFo2 of Frankliniella occidentalis]
MAYMLNLEDAKQTRGIDTDVCFCCDRHFAKNQPVVVYDGAKRPIAMHPSCANAMAQRLITDTWVKRREWQDELINLK